MWTTFSCWNVMIVASVYVCSQFFEDAAAEVTLSFHERFLARRRDCRVTADVGVVVFLGNISFTPEDQCAANNASSIADLWSMNILRPCLSYVFRHSPVHIARLDEDSYIDIITMTAVSPQSPYRVVCLRGKQKLAHPVITSFTLQLWDDQKETILWGYNLLDSNITSVTIPVTNNNTVNVSCQVNGYPKPQVVITHDNETCDMFPPGTCLISPLMQHSSVFSCLATNILASTQARMLVYVSDPETDVHTSQNGKAALVWIVIGVVAAILLFMISTVVIVVKRKRKDLLAATVHIEQKLTDENHSVPRTPCGSNAARRYEMMISATSPDTGYMEADDQHYETTIYETPDMEDHYRTEYLEIVDAQYETSDNSVYARNIISQGDNSYVQYENIRSNI